MEEMILDCIFCGQHEISLDNILYHIAISTNRDIEVVTLPLGECPLIEECRNYSELIATKYIKHNFTINIYKLHDIDHGVALLIVFYTKEGPRISDTLSIDQVKRILDELKIMLLTTRIENSRKKRKKDSISQELIEKRILARINKQLESLYNSLLNLMGNL